MRKKDLIYLASTTILLAASSQQVLAEDLAPTVPTSQTSESSQQSARDTSQASSSSASTSLTSSEEASSTSSQTSSEASNSSSQASSEVAAESQASEVSQATSEEAEATKESKTDETATSSAEAATKEQKEAAPTEQAVTEASSEKKEEKETTSQQGQASFYSAPTQNGTERSNPQAGVRASTFVDVSSHNGTISEEDYRELIKKGVAGVVVKLTEGTHYVNPYAESQIKNAQRAGLQVSAYAFSHYTSADTAKAEARYFVEHAKKLNLPTTTLMVNDMEDPKMQANINPNTQIWADEMKRLGFSNLMYYTSASWIDNNNLRNKGPVQTAKFGLTNFWVAQYPAPKLSADDAKNLKYNSGAGAWQFTSQAQLLAGKHVFDQSVDYTGRFTDQAPIAKQALKGKISIENKNSVAGTFDVVVSDVSAPYGVKEVKLAVWSTGKPGEDTLKWYSLARQSDGSYKAHIESSAHKNVMGQYFADAYVVENDGRVLYLTGTTTTVSRQNSSAVQLGAKISVINNNNQTGSFDLVIKDVASPTGVKEVRLAVWSTGKPGENTLNWYNAVRQLDGSYKAHIDSGAHKGVTGKYLADVYVVGNDEKMLFLTGTTTTVNRQGVVSSQSTKPSAKVAIVNNDSKVGSFDVILHSLVAPTGVKEVRLAVWSTGKPGEDTLKWYSLARQSDGSYKAHIESSGHKYATETYLADAYLVGNDNKSEYLTGATTTVRRTEPVPVIKEQPVSTSPNSVQLGAKISVINNNNQTGSFDLVIKDVASPTGVKEVRLAVWSTGKPGENTLNWYNAVRQLDGSYKAHIDSGAHKGVTGKYLADVYVVGNDEKMLFLTGTTTTVNRQGVVSSQSTKPSAKVAIVNNDSKVGSFDVILHSLVAPTGVKEVRLAVWSTGKPGEDTLKWYSLARQSDGSYKAHIESSGHKYATGTYLADAYLVGNDNKSEYLTGATTTVRRTEPVPVNQVQSVLNAAAALVGVRGGSAEHQRLVDDYNSVKPLPVGYAVKNSDDWCDVFTTVVFQRQGLSHLIGRECGVERHIQIFKNLGIWNEDGNATPKAGDIITFNWDQSTQQNNGWADHIGIVEKVENGIIHTIEGNSNNQVKRNTYRIGHGNIRGFATPRYA